MALKKVEFHLPEKLLESLGSDTEVEAQALQAFVFYLLQEGKITGSRGAELLGISYREMLDLMGKHEIPLVNYSPQELTEEIQALDKLLD